ncbi:hypothetical protein ABPG74_005841 [Tetrahymena malaccensis]
MNYSMKQINFGPLSQQDLKREEPEDTQSYSQYLRHYSGNYQENNQFQPNQQVLQNNQGILRDKVCQYLKVVKDNKERDYFKQLFLEILEKVSTENQFQKKLYYTHKNLASRYYKWRRRQKIKNQKAQDTIEIHSQSDEQSGNQEFSTANQNEINKIEASSNSEEQYSSSQLDSEKWDPNTNNTQLRQNSNQIQSIVQTPQVDLSMIDNNKYQQIAMLLNRIEIKNNNLVDISNEYVNNLKQWYQASNQHIMRIKLKNQHIQNL